MTILNIGLSDLVRKNCHKIKSGKHEKMNYSKSQKLCEFCWGFDVIFYRLVSAYIYVIEERREILGVSLFRLKTTGWG